MSKFKKYYSAIKYLEDLASEPHDQQYMRAGAKDPSIFLKRTRRFIKLLGNPDQDFKYIHVSGTSGKGSTAAYLHEILSRAGFNVGSFCSPHSTTTIERIKVNEKLIDPIVFAQILEQARPSIKKMSQIYKYDRPSYFEILFGIALLYFKKMKCEWAILEVGCGGSYDATNIIGKSISAITNIGLDHTKILGKTLSKIAKDKAGIIKPGTHFFTTEKRQSILKIFKTICKQKHTKFHRVKTCSQAPLSFWSHVPMAIESIRNKRQDSISIEYNASRMTNNKGKFQSANQALAKAIAKQINIKNNVIEQAIKTTKLPPCRFEIMRKNPLIILDGAHNPDKIKSVVHNLKNLTYGTLYTIFAASITKNAASMLKILLPHVDEIVFTKFKTSDRASYEPETLSKLAKSFKNKSIEHNSLKALKNTIKKLKTDDCLLITGSFYLAGELRKQWIAEDYILINRTYNNAQFPNINIQIPIK